MPEQVQPRSFLEEVSLGRENSRCKGPEAGVSLEGQRTIKESSVAGTERGGREVIRGKVGGGHRGQMQKGFYNTSRVLAFT